MSEPAEATGGQAGGVAGRLTDLLAHLYGQLPSITVTGWDGSRSAGPGDLVVHVRSRKGVRRLLWSPGELGVAQAYVAGELDIEGDLAHAVTVLRDYEALTAEKGPLGSADRREVLRTTVLLGAVGPAPRAPEEVLDAVASYAPVDREMADQLPPILARLVLGDADADAGASNQTIEIVADAPEPLSALVLAWEKDDIVVEEIRDISDEHACTLTAWSTNLHEHRGDAVAAAGESRVRTWELSLVLDRDNLARDRVRVYRAVGTKPATT